MISVVIVTWNSGDEIEQCLTSLYSDLKNSSLDYEVIVVDNFSSDNTIKKIQHLNFDHLTLIENKENFGYTIACNQGMKISKGNFIFLLNPDTKLYENVIKTLVTKLTKNENIGAVAPALINQDGTLQDSCRNFPEINDMFWELSVIFKKYSNWKLKNFKPENDIRVDQPMAAALMIRKNILEKINYMDERFKMFFNDVDLCKKIYLSGYTIYYLPEAKIIHDKGVSIYKDRANMIKIWNDDCISYFKKYNYASIKISILKILLKLSSKFRK